MLRTKRITITALGLSAALALWLPTAAFADIVSGRIYGADKKPVVNSTFAARTAKGETTTLKTDNAGNFSVYLDPGKFTVSSSADPTLTGIIESFPQPRQQDVYLTKEK